MKGYVFGLWILEKLIGGKTGFPFLNVSCLLDS